MPLIKPKIVEVEKVVEVEKIVEVEKVVEVEKIVEVEKVVEVEKNNPLHEEFILDSTRKGVWVTSDIWHVYGKSDTNVSGISDNILLFKNQDVVVLDNTKHYMNHTYAFHSAMTPIRGHIFYDAKRDDITYTDDYKYYAIMDTDMKCWQILKSCARESVVGTTTGIASSIYGVTKIVEINKNVACDESGKLKDELLGATLSAWTGYWKNTKSGTTIYYNTWKA